VTIEGLDEAKKNLVKLGNQLSRLREPALEAGSLIITNSAKSKVRVKTHDLQRSIHFQTLENTRIRTIVVVGPTVPYGRRIELGFSGVDRMGRKYNQRPYPYLRPAYYENKDLVEKEVFAVLELLPKVWR